jgi:hypothetical protein
MKKLKWLLLLANIGLLIYFNIDRVLPQTPHIKWPELEPEKITVLTEAQLKALPKKTLQAPVAVLENTTTTTDAPQKTMCAEWGNFTDASLEKAQKLAAQLAIQGTVNELSATDKKRYWVYIPPLTSSKEAQAYAAKLKNLGVEDLYVVQEPKWKYAISLGLFSDETLAQHLLDNLKIKGVNDAEKTLWQPNSQFNLIFTDLTTAQAGALYALSRDFPKVKLKEISCEQAVLQP